MIKIPFFPLYSKTQKLLKILVGKNESEFKTMKDNIWNLRGTPQETENWQDPDTWIKDKLKGTDAYLAKLIWEESQKEVNPRYMNGPMYLATNFELLESVNNIFHLTRRGEIFVTGSENEIMKEIDIEEGCIFALNLCSIYDNAKMKELLQNWQEFSIANSNNRSDSVIKDTLRTRLANLVDRKYLIREGNTYNITESGKQYLNEFNTTDFAKSIKAELPEILDLNKQIEEYDKNQKKILKERLFELTPYQFENLIKSLLEEMGYEDVKVTSPTNDKGVDVTGIIQNGITSIKEVVQVKRHNVNIQRTVLDSLRGCLHRFDAIKGTIITLSDFSKGAKDAAFEKGAAPITLINGDKLIDLLVENEVGVKNKQITTFVLNEDFFKEIQQENLE